MGANPRFKELSDLIHHKANLRVTCPKCGRTGVFPTQQVIDYFRNRGWNTALEVAAGYFRCDGDLKREKGCGHRGARLSMEPIPEPIVTLKPKPTERDIRKEMQRRR